LKALPAAFGFSFNFNFNFNFNFKTISSRAARLQATYFCRLQQK